MHNRHPKGPSASFLERSANVLALTAAGGAAFFGTPFIYRASVTPVTMFAYENYGALGHVVPAVWFVFIGGASFVLANLGIKLVVTGGLARFFKQLLS